MDTIAVSFIVYSFAVLAVGIYSARYSRASSSDFFLANRGLGPWIGALSSSASAESGFVTLGVVGTAFSTGISAAWIIPGSVAAIAFNWFVLANRLRKFSADDASITIPDVLAGRHEGTAALLIRLMCLIIIVSMLTAYVAAQLNAAGKTFNATFEWPYSIGVLTGAGIVLGYTITGGFRAVAWTDMIQALMMVAAVLVLPIVLLMHLGGTEVLWMRLNSLEPDLMHPFAEKAGMALVGAAAVWLGVPLGYPGQPHILVRFMAIRDEAAVRHGRVIASTWILLLLTGAVFLGLAARAVYGSLGDPEQALPIAAQDFLPGVIAGFIVAAVLAAICSTADSQLLVSASAVSHDFYVRILRRQPDDRTRTMINRGSVLMIGVIATAIALGEVRAVFDFVLYAWAGLGAAFGPALILTLLWRRTTGWGELAGMLTGSITVVVWRELPYNAIYELGPAFVLAFAAIVVVSLLMQKSGTDPKRSVHMRLYVSRTAMAEISTLISGTTKPVQTPAFTGLISCNVSRNTPPIASQSFWSL